LDKAADEVVIGGGIMDASMAHSLANGGFGKVALLEKRTLAAVSPGHSAANVRTYYSNEMTVKPFWIGRRSYHSGHHPVVGDLLR
jgi:glycine/D-amino acid oxidase-like deaminating enzyme